MRLKSTLLYKENISLWKSVRRLMDDTSFRFIITPDDDFEQLINRQVVAVFSGVVLAYRSTKTDDFRAYLAAALEQCCRLRYLYSMARYKAYIDDESAIVLIDESTACCYALRAALNTEKSK